MSIEQSPEEPIKFLVYAPTPISRDTTIDGEILGQDWAIYTWPESSILPIPEQTRPVEVEPQIMKDSRRNFTIGLKTKLTLAFTASFISAAIIWSSARPIFNHGLPSLDPSTLGLNCQYRISSEFSSCTLTTNIKQNPTPTPTNLPFDGRVRPIEAIQTATAQAASK